MKTASSLLLLLCLITTAIATAMTYIGDYPSGHVTQHGAIRDHKAQGVVNGMHRWSSGRYQAYWAGNTLVVRTVNMAADRTSAAREVAEMWSLVGHFASDRKV